MDGYRDNNGQPYARRGRFQPQQNFNIPPPAMLNAAPPLGQQAQANAQPQQPANVAQQLNDITARLNLLATTVQGETPASHNFTMPAKYRGRSDPRDFETFLKELYRIGQYYNWNNAKFLKTLPLLLEGEALAIFDNLNPQIRADWQQLTDSLYDKFEASQSALKKLMFREQREHESVAESRQRFSVW